jgi:hypothetical protein
MLALGGYGVLSETDEKCLVVDNPYMPMFRGKAL